MMIRNLAFTLVVVVAGIAFGGGSTASAADVLPGFDLFATDPHTTFLDIDPDGPGPEPPQTIAFQGDPLLPSLFNTDTIVERKTGIALFGVGQTDTVDIELVALSLVSVDPINVGGVDFDVKIESGSLLNTPGPFFRDAAIPSSPVNENGMTISHDVIDGGFWQSWLTVNARTTLIEVGDETNLSEFFDQQTFDIPNSQTFAGVWNHQDLATLALPLADRVTAGVASGDFFAAVSPGPIPVALPPGLTFSVDYQGPSAGNTPGPMTGVPDSFFGVPMDEGSIYTPFPPGPPGPNPATPGPLPPPGLEVSAVAGGPGVVPGGLHIVPGIFGAVELDALSYGKDFGDELYFSVDEFAVGIAGSPAPPNVFTEGADAAGNMEASADVFHYLGVKTPTDVPAVIPGGVPGNTDFIDGDGVAPFGPLGSFPPGTGLIEPNPPNSLPDLDDGDNLDAVDLDTHLAYLSGPIFLSLDSEFPDPLETGLSPPNTGTAVGNGFVGGDVLVQLIRSTPLLLYADAALDLGLDRWADADPMTIEPDTDDLDALTLIDNGAVDALGDLFYDPASDTLLYSVRRNSAVIGVLDSRFGVAIEEGDILEPPLAIGLPPRIFVAAEALGLATLRSGFAVPFGDDLDALDMFERPEIIVPPRDKVLTIERATFAAHGILPAMILIDGDYNFNGEVDAADYTVWANTFGQIGPGLPADGNGNLTVDAADYTIWANNFGAVAPGPSPVPEPSAFVLSALGLIGLLTFGWRRRRRA